MTVSPWSKRSNEVVHVKRVVQLDEFQHDEMLETKTIELPVATFVFQLRPDTLWQVTMTYPRRDDEAVTVGIESSWSMATAWMNRILMTGEDTDMVDRENGVKSVLPRADLPNFNYNWTEI